VIWVRTFKPTFSERSSIAGPGEMSIALLLDQNPKVASVGLGVVVVGRA
jgi:hypothetical protein